MPQNHLTRPTKTQNRPRGRFIRQRCTACFRPLDQCYCSSITPVDTRTHFLIIQHRRERTHPFNSARIAARALTNSALICERNEQLKQLHLPLQPTSGLLYPAPNAKLLTSVDRDQLPDQLVVLDGTWHQAKTLYRDHPTLKRLPCYRLAPATPGQFRIRLEPHPQALSTIEAIAAAITQMEPDNRSVDRLLDGFHAMIEKQLARSRVHYSGATTKAPTIGNLNVPKCFSPTSQQSIVVVYAEATPLKLSNYQGWASLNQVRKHLKLAPVVVCAQRIDPKKGRLGNNEAKTPEENLFFCLLKPTVPLNSEGLDRLEITAGDFQRAVSNDQFCRQWQGFLRPGDRLIAYHNSSIELLKNAGANVHRFDLLNAINYDPQGHFSSVEQFLASVDHPVHAPLLSARAGRRLAESLALTRYFVAQQIQRDMA